MHKKIFIILFLAAVFFTIYDNKIFSEEISLEAIKKTVKEAIREIQQEEIKKQEEFSAELNIKLDAAIEDWIISQKKLLAPSLNQLLRERWEMLKKRTTPIPYEYYLRDYAYFVVKKDIFKTDSISAPYKALIEIIEEKYIERYHSPDIGNVKEYLHTVVRPMQIDAEYRQDNFLITGATDGAIYIAPGWESKKSE
jgi:deoxyribodipyrimidine photolyase-like uncharacterized protein